MPPDAFVEDLPPRFEQARHGRRPMADEDSPTMELSRQFLRNTLAECQAGLLKKSSRVRVVPEYSPFPRTFRFEFDLPFKSKEADQPVQLKPGPLRGTIFYRRDLFVNFDIPSVAVALDPEQHFFHPNFSRQHGMICLGEIPPGPYPLDILLENHLYPILSYQNRRPTHPADLEAARYFALDPDAMVGLEVQPLY